MRKPRRLFLGHIDVTEGAGLLASLGPYAPVSLNASFESLARQLWP